MERGRVNAEHVHKNNSQMAVHQAHPGNDFIQGDNGGLEGNDQPYHKYGIHKTEYPPLASRHNISRHRSKNNQADDGYHRNDQVIYKGTAIVHGPDGIYIIVKGQMPWKPQRASCRFCRGLKGRDKQIVNREKHNNGQQEQKNYLPLLSFFILYVRNGLL